MQHEYFVYDGQEVIRTGRIASRDYTVRGYNGTKNVTETVIEITPVTAPGEYAWKRWVTESELYIINDTHASDEIQELPVDPKKKPEEPEPESDDPNYDPLDELLNGLRGRKGNGKT